MNILLSKEKFIEVMFKYPIAYFSIFFLYSTRSQYYVIDNIATYDSIIHNLLIFWGLAIIFYGFTANRGVFNYNKRFIFFWIVSSVITIIVNISQIRFDSIRSAILTIIVIVTFLCGYSILRERYTDAEVFKYVFYPTIFLKFISSLISLSMYFYNMSIFVISELPNPYTYGLRYVSLGNDTYNLLLYGTFFSPNKEVMQAIPLMLVTTYILLSKKIAVNKFERIILYAFFVLEYIVVALCNSRGALYSITVVIILFIVIVIIRKTRGNSNISVKKVLLLVASLCIMLLGYNEVKVISATIVSKIDYKRHIYENDKGKIIKVSEENIRNNVEYEKYRGKIFEYNPGDKNGKTEKEIKDKIVIDKADSGEELGNGRVSIWKETLRMFIKKPVFGIGQGMNTEFAKKFESSKFPILYTGVAIHNSYLALLLFHGVTGALVVFLWLFKVLISCLKFELRNNNIEFSIIHMNLYFILIVSVFLDVIFIRDEFTQLMMLFSIGYLMQIKGD
jgi:membrane protein